MRQGILADADHGNPMVRGWPELDANASCHFMILTERTGEPSTRNNLQNVFGYQQTNLFTEMLSTVLLTFHLYRS